MQGLEPLVVLRLDYAAFPPLARVAGAVSWWEYKLPYGVWRTPDSLRQLNTVVMIPTANNFAPAA